MKTGCKKSYFLIVLVSQICLSQSYHDSQRQNNEYKRLSEATSRAYNTNSSRSTNSSTYKPYSSSSSSSSSSSNSSSTYRSGGTSIPASTSSSWANYSQINRQNRDAAAYNAKVDAAKASYEDKLSRFDNLTKERKLSKTRENYYALYQCALEAGFDDYMAGRMVGFSETDYQEKLVLLGLVAPQNTSQYNNNTSTDPNVNGNFTGYGTKNFSNGTYVGDLVSGMQEGNGKMTYNSGDTYEGQFQQNNIEGFGTVKWTNGNIYTGNHRKNKRYGQGKFVFANGDTYEGNYIDDKEFGIGKYIWKDGTVYEGYFVDDKLTGNGKLTKTNGFYRKGTYENNGITFKYYSASGNEITQLEYDNNVVNDPNEVKNYFVETSNNSNAVTTATGLKYIVLKQGNGAKPKMTSTVKVSYQGTLTNGTVFDSSKNYGGSLELPLDGVILAWSEALQLMNVGSQYQLFVPSHLAYGTKGIPNKVKPNETVIYTISLLEVK